MTDSGETLKPGTLLVDLEIEGVLGRGEFGVTYLARDTALNARRAVKEYLPRDWGARRADGTVGPRARADAADYRWGLKRFLEEARILARFDHRHLVRVHRVFKAQGTAYMVTEYVDGQTLAAEAATGPLTGARVREVLVGLADGLEALHKAGLLHRDIRPGNVMVRQDGTPVLIDFGSARQAMGRRSRSVTALLTPGFAPIEQYSARGHQGPWTDIYALGALAYWALSGEPPEDATERVRMDRLLPVAQAARTNVSARTAAAVEAALAVNEVDRPQELKEWLAALDGPAPITVPKGRQETAPRRSRRSDRESDEVPKWWRNMPVLIGAVLMVALLVVAFGVLWDGSESNDDIVLDGPNERDPESPVARADREPAALESGAGREVETGGEEATERPAVEAAEAGSRRQHSSVSVSATDAPSRASESAQPRPAGDKTAERKSTEPASVLGGSAILIAETTPPGAEVLLDGTLVGETPLQRSDIRAGVRVVTLRHPHCETMRISDRNFEDGVVLRVERELQRGAGRLTVLVTAPDAWVEVEGSGRAQRTPVTLEDIPAGPVGVRLGAPEHRVVAVEVEIPMDGVARLERELERIPHGSLTLDLEPPGATVTLLDSGLRYRPGVRLPEGSHRVVVRSEGYREADRTVTVSGSTRIRIVLDIAELRAGDSRVFDGMQFMWIPEGEFDMGSTSAEAEDVEQPVTRVRISQGFWLGKHEVTQAQWATVMRSNPSYFNACGPDCPVENVSWNDVQDFVRQLNDRSGGPRGAYRLPTEAEWEYAARAGTTGDTHGGDLRILGTNNAPVLDGIAWYGGNSGVPYEGATDCSGWEEKQYSSSWCGPHPVGRKRANAWGLHDMIGNVFEWVQDWSGAYPGGAVMDPAGPPRGSVRMLRGGSWVGSPRYCRSASRLGDDPSNPSGFLGFRLVRTR